LRSTFVVTLAIFLAMSGLAQAGDPVATPEEAPRPEARPEVRTEAPPPQTSIEDDRQEATPAAPPTREQLAETEAAFSACTAALKALGAVFAERPPLTEASERDCGIERPVVVAKVLPGVTVRPEAVMRCETALALAKWTKEFAMPAAQHLSGRGELTGIDHGTAYLCRPRNGIAGETLSEHAFGNAIDIAGFRFEKGEAVNVAAPGREGSLEEAFVQAVRKTACLSFTTVLGPGADEAHADHLHLDVKARSGGFRICQ